MKKNKILIKCAEIFRTIILIGMCFIIILPLYQMFVSSISGSSRAFLVPENISFRSYEQVINKIKTEHLLFNSLVLATSCGIVEVIFSSLAGFAFAKLIGKAGNILFYIYLTTLLLPVNTLRVAYQHLFVNIPFFGIKLFGNKFSIIIYYMFGGGIKSAIFVYLFRSLYRNMDNEIIEQSLIDGSSTIKTFFKIILPNSMSAIIPTFLLTFIWVYNDTELPNFFNLSYDNFSQISTAIFARRMGGTSTSFVIMIPLLVIYGFVQEKFFVPFKFDISS